MKIEKLTPEQEIQLEIYKNKWLNKIFSYELNKKSSFENTKKQMKDLYSSFGLKEPSVLLLDSPMACQVAANMMRNKEWSNVRTPVWYWVKTQVEAQVKTQVWDQVWDQVGTNVGDQVRTQVEAQVKTQVWAQVKTQVMTQVKTQVWSNVVDQVKTQVMTQVGTNVGDQVEDNELGYYPFSDYVNYTEFGILSFLDFMDECLNLNSSEKLKRRMSWTESSFMSIQLDGLCIVSNFPSFISRNENNDLHNLEGYAVEFNDGYGQHYINGKYLPENIFNDIKSGKYSLEIFLKEQNEEIKSTAIEMMQLVHGDSFLVRFFGDNLKEVDVFLHKKEEKHLKGTTGGMNIGVYTLYKGEINGDNIAYVQCYCPSTDRMFFLGVEPRHTNAKDAIASLYRVPTIVKNDIKSISRQGERFYTTFTEKGYKKLESCKQIEKYSTISGDEYFSKMEYEY